MNTISPHEGPIFQELEGCETVFAKDQPQYRPLRVIFSGNTVLTRWTPTDAQRKRIAAGEDLFLECMTFGQPLQPIRLTVGMTLEEGKAILGLTEEVT